jgi:PAS domain S-box-containing protein
MSLRAVLDHMGDGVIALDRDGRCVYVNPGAAALLHIVRPAELLGRPLDAALADGVRAPLLQACQQALRTQQPVVREDYDAPQERWLQSRVFPSPTGVSVHLADISERRREEQRLRAAAEQSRVTLQSIGDAVIATDAQGRVVLLNPVAESLTGWTMDAARGRPLDAVFRIVSEATRAPEPSPVERVLREGQVVGLANHTLLVARDGTERPIADSGAPIRDAAGRITGVVLVFRDQTDERAARQAVAASERRYRLLFEANPQPCWVYDLETLAFLAVNDAAVKRYGWSREQFLAMTIADIRPPEDLPRLRDSVTHTPEGLEDAGVWRHLRKDGSLIDVEITSHTLQFEGRRAKLVVAHDVTARLRAERERLEAEARFRHFFDAGLVGMAITVPSKNWGRFNDRLCQMLGYSQQEMAGLTWAELTHPDDLAADLAQFEQVMAGSSDGYAMEKRFIRKDGSVLHAAIAVRAERDSAGRAQRFFAIVEDIGARRRVEETLRVKEAALDSAVSGIALADPDGRLTYVNPAFCAMWRAEAAQLLGTPAITHWVESAQAVQVIEALRTHGRWSGEMRARRADGSWFDAELLAAMVHDTAGRPLCLMGSFVDVTERRQAREALARSRDELEREVQERTRELVAARDQAEQASRAKSEFLSRMSHELRTPLNAIIGFGQLLELDARLDARQHGYAQQILGAGRHLLELINEVLDLARIEAGRITLAPEPLALAELFDECLRMVGMLAAERRVQLQADAPGAMKVQADRTRLRQVLLNLLSNAVKYNHDGGAVTLAAQDRGGDRVRIEVRDTGPGIAPELQSRLFEPFNRLGAEGGPVQGTGIGLSIVRQLVQMMDGALGVESRPGAGACFWIDLPAAADGTVPAAGAGAVARSAPCVLYVEDNAANRALVEQLFALRRPGVTLLTAPTAREGLACARARRPDLLLLDLNLPDGDGYSLRAQLAADPVTAGAPAVAVTAYALADDVQRIEAAGFAAYVVKPIDVARFDAVLDRLLPRG